MIYMEYGCCEGLQFTIYITYKIYTHEKQPKMPEITLFNAKYIHRYVYYADFKAWLERHGKNS